MDEGVLTLIAEVGFPIVSALSVGAAIWAVMRWMMNSLHRDIEEVKAKLDTSNQSEMEILVKLIDRVRKLEDSVTRTEIVMRTAHNLEQEWQRVGRSDD